MNKSFIESLCGERAKKRLAREGVREEAIDKFTRLMRLMADGAEHLIRDLLPSGRATVRDMDLLTQAVIYSKIVFAGQSWVTKDDLDRILPGGMRMLARKIKSVAGSKGGDDEVFRLDGKGLEQLDAYLDKAFQTAADEAEKDPLYAFKAAVLTVTMEYLINEKHMTPGQIAGLFSGGEVGRMMRLSYEELTDAARCALKGQVLRPAGSIDFYGKVAAKWLPDILESMKSLKTTEKVPAGEKKSIEDALVYAHVAVLALPGLTPLEREKRILEFRQAMRYLLFGCEPEDGPDGSRLFVLEAGKRAEIVDFFVPTAKLVLDANRRQPDFLARTFAIFFRLVDLKDSVRASAGRGKLSREVVERIMTVPPESLEEELERFALDDKVSGMTMN